MGSLKKNIIYQSAYQILLIIMPLITSPYLSRVLGPEGLGINSYNYSIVYYFMLFAGLGISNYGNRSIAASRNNLIIKSKTFWEILCAHFMLSGIVIFVYILYGIFISDYKVVTFIQLMYLIGVFFDISWFYFGEEKFANIVFVNLVCKILTFTSTFLFVKDENDLIIYIFIISLGYLWGYILQWMFLPKSVIWIKPDIQGILRHIKPMFILFLPSIAVSLYKVMDKIMLGRISAITEVAFYTNAEDVINIPISIVGAFGTVMLSRTSNLIAKGEIDKSKSYIQDSLIVVSWLAMALMFGISAISYNFTIIFWGKEFVSCAPLISILVFTIPFITVANIVRTQYLIPNCRDLEYLFSIITGAVINFCLNFLLIPRLGAMGAAIGTLFAEAGVCIVQILFVYKEIPILKYLKCNLPYLVFGIVMYIFVNRVNSFIENKILCLFVQIIPGIVIYVIPSLIYWRYFLFKTKFSEIYRKIRK